MNKKASRQVEVLLRGIHPKDEVRRSAAAALGCDDADISWLDSPGTTARFILDTRPGEDGFRTQVSLILDAREETPADDLAWARLLAARLRDDALALTDPTRPGEEPFHGLLVRADGSTYRVPLLDLDSGGIGIVEDRSRWTDWRA